jgi:plasmid stability protein
MPQILVRNLSSETISSLKKKAKQHGRSLQEEVKRILEQQTHIGHTKFWEEANLIRTRLQQTGQSFSDSTELIREDRER